MSLFQSLGLILSQNGARCAFGLTNVNGSATVVTGLRTVEHVLVALEDPPEITALWPHGAPGTADGDIDLAVKKPTAADNAAPIAGTSAIGVYWLAIGT